ncbi:hypothetical protein FNQ90_20255 [Streptomyces alkaliphilus]|uniref:Uncharacterized protein n=1 Tax=Streptomyces alkaliphilus TaxID=1472722 RepID=A0A7W3TGT8_9ACTN|nr:hypothetical protein [Streptomyces alkaliphilus]MBB0246380.1 hypothetical protein [Streptomyces alkaliphilus]
MVFPVLPAETTTTSRGWPTTTTPNTRATPVPAILDLALLSGASPRRPEGHLRQAVLHHSDAYTRSRAISGTKLATLMMHTGDPREAAITALRALDEIGRIRSRRARDNVRALATAATPHRRRPEVAELRRRITETLAP